MGAFVDTTRIPIREGADTFWIKPRMDFGTKCLVEDTLTRMAITDGQTGELQFSFGARKLALAIHNIVAWEGPDFTDVVCTPENIKKLDSNYPVFVKAREEINRLNRETPGDTLGPKDTTTGTDG